MKRLICVLTMAAVLGTLAACVSKTEEHTFPDDVDGEAVMFVYKISNGGECDESTDYRVNRSYSVRCDGIVEYAENYNISGSVVLDEASLSDEDLQAIYATAYKFMYSHDGEVYDYNSCDAPVYTFTLYDEEGEPHRLATSDQVIEEMEDVVDILYSYFPDQAPAQSSGPADDPDETGLADEWQLRVTVITNDTDDGYATHVSYLVSWNATLERSGSDLNCRTTIIDFDDLCTAERFLRRVLSGDIVNPQNLNTPDGVLYNFVYTGDDGEAHAIYVSGVLDGEALEVYEALSSYFA